MKLIDSGCRWYQMKNEANETGTNDELGNQGLELHLQTPGNITQELRSTVTISMKILLIY